ncbi:MAG: hypothetical protein PVI40_01810 [Chlamydiota bacterium]|jgi:hypothetical protein
MKVLKLFIFFFPFTFLFSTPINNPALPAFINSGVFFSSKNPVNVRAGYEGNFISDARLKQTSGSSGRVDDFKVNVNSGIITFNIMDWVDLFGTLGSGRIKTDWRITPPGGGNFRIETETRYKFSWSSGAKLLIYKWENTAIGISGRYFSTIPELSWLTIDGEPVSVDDATLRYKEWQIELGISHRVGIFVPYAGIKYSDAFARIRNLSQNIDISDDGSNNINMKRKDHVGAFLGVTLTNGEKFLLNIEARLADEEAGTVSGEIRF